MLKEHYLNVHCSRSILRHAPGALCTLHTFQEHICYMPLEHVHSNMLLEQSMFNLEYYPRLFMLREQLFLKQLLLEHNFGPKSHRSQVNTWFNKYRWKNSKLPIGPKLFKPKIRWRGQPALPFKYRVSKNVQYPKMQNFKNFYYN